LRVQALILSYDVNTPLTEGAWLERKAGVEGDAVALVWLVSALEYARAQRRSKIVDYLETVADDVVFETEMAARRVSLLSRARRMK
jgi:hypothetical protein